jgi:hypothetical protein
VWAVTVRVLLFLLFVVPVGRYSDGNRLVPTAAKDWNVFLKIWEKGCKVLQNLCLYRRDM